MSAYLTAVNQMRTVKILGVKNETPTVKSFTFHDKLCAKAEPGQFVMVWIPGVDEVPMTLSAMDSEKPSAITVEKIGVATRAIHKMFMLTERYKTPLQASLERLMRCAIGLCGTCVIGRYRVCRDGPVFSSQQLREVRDEFGRFKRGFDGKRIPLE